MVVRIIAIFLSVVFPFPDTQPSSLHQWRWGRAHTELHVDLEHWSSLTKYFNIGQAMDHILFYTAEIQCSQEDLSCRGNDKANENWIQSNHGVWVQQPRTPFNSTLFIQTVLLLTMSSSSASNILQSYSCDGNLNSFHMTQASCNSLFSHNLILSELQIKKVDMDPSMSPSNSPLTFPNILFLHNQ